MTYLEKNAQFATVEEGMQKLKDSVSIRNQMGGALYFNILNDDCCRIASKVLEIGGNREEIANLLGKENFR